MKKINNYIKEIRNILSLSTSAYDSWWTLCGADSQKYKDIMVTFPTHFKLSKYSYMCIVITTLFMLLEDKNKTINIKELLRLITPEKQFKPRDIKLLKEKIEKSEVIWKKICILRHNQFAHFNYQLSTSGPFKRSQH